MNPKAIEEAKIRLQRAREAVAVLEGVKKEGRDFSFAEIDSAWWAFLLAASGIYTKLEQGAKGNGKSTAWFGREKHLRKKDSLLSYLHHARNSEEHSIEGSTHPTGFTIKSTNPRVKVVYSDPDTLEVDRIEVPADLKQGDPIGEFVVLGLRLVKVTDSRYGDTFSVPTHHLGQPIPDISPLGVAMLGLAYLEKLVAEASALN